MRKKQIIILGIVMGVTLLGLIFTQANYFQTAFKLKKAQFDYLVNKSINETISVLEDRDRQQKESEKSFLEARSFVEHGGVHEIPLGLEINSVVQVSGEMNIVGGQPLVDMEYDVSHKENNVLLGRSGNRSLQNSIEKSRQELKKSLGKDYDLIVVSKASSIIENT